MEHCRLLITAGPTHEPIDAVRYLANRSSGRLGIAIAQAAASRGVSATLLLGPTHLQPNLDQPGQHQRSSHLRVIRFQTAADLQNLLAEQWPSHDVLIMAAAVADYRPVNVEIVGKLRRTGETLTMEFEPTPDLLAELATMTTDRQRVIGFALEPHERLMESAREKLSRKRLDAIVANPLETMDAERITATLLLRDGRTLAAPPELPKADFAAWLLDQLQTIHPVARH